MFYSVIKNVYSTVMFQVEKKNISYESTTSYVEKE